MTVKVRLTGVPKAIAEMGKLARAIQRKALAEAASEGLQPVLEEAQRLAPVGETGRLKASLKKQVWEIDDDEVEFEVISDPDVAFYGHMIEYGTRHSEPRPFLRPALDAKKGEAEAKVRQILAARIGKAVR